MSIHILEQVKWISSKNDKLAVENYSKMYCTYSTFPAKLRISINISTILKVEAEYYYFLVSGIDCTYSQFQRVHQFFLL